MPHRAQSLFCSCAPDAVRPENLFIQIFMLLSIQGARFERERPLGLPPSPDLRPQVGRDFQSALSEPLHEQVAHLLGV